MSAGPAIPTLPAIHASSPSETKSKSQTTILQELCSIGVKSVHGKYLTLESFGNVVNCDGVALRSKQIWTLETDGSKFALKSHKGTYLSVDHKTVSVNNTKGSKEHFHFQFSTGVVTIKTSEEKFLSVDASGKLEVVENRPESFELERPIHPQVCLQLNKCYLSLEGNEIATRAQTQFGKETLFTLEPAGERGQFSLRACNGKFLASDTIGSITVNATSNSDISTHFAWEFQGQNLLLKSVLTRKYCGSQGNKLKASSSSITLKEIFTLVDSDAQITLKASNGKNISAQGENFVANSLENSHKEIFILEAKGSKWALRSEAHLYVEVDSQGGVFVKSSTLSENCLFEMEYHETKTAFKGKNGKYLSSKPLGAIDCKSSSATEKELFQIFFFNRPQIVLQCHQTSFVGVTEGKIKTNRSKGDAFTLEFKDGKYSLKTSDGKFLKEGAESRISLSPEPEWFTLEFHQNKLALKNEKGKYLRSENQGYLTAVADSITATELFEF